MLRLPQKLGAQKRLCVRVVIREAEDGPSEPDEFAAPPDLQQEIDEQPAEDSEDDDVVVDVAAPRGRGRDAKGRGKGKAAKVSGEDAPYENVNSAAGVKIGSITSWHAPFAFNVAIACDTHRCRHALQAHRVPSLEACREWIRMGTGLSKSSTELRSLPYRIPWVCRGFFNLCNVTKVRCFSQGQCLQ